MKSPVAPSKLTLRDLASEALAGVLQRPGRAALTALGTVVGVATFVIVLGLTATVGGQISSRFTVLGATEVQVEDTSADPGLDGPAFPEDAAGRVRAIHGVVQAGVYWSAGERTVNSRPLADTAGTDAYPVVAASPGAVTAMHPAVATGRLFDDFHNRSAEPVALLGEAMAKRLGITRLDSHPAVFVAGVPLTVIGILGDAQRHGDLLLSVVVPERTVERLWGPPAQGEPSKMIVETQIGAAQVVASQVAVALRPDAPDRLKVTAPPDPRSLRDSVATDLNSLFLALALTCLGVGMVGIANTTFVAVLERTGEIGLRRSFGARGSHIAAQFLLESAILGTMGGLIGTCVGTLSVVAIAATRHWTAVVEPWTVLPAPLLGTVTGILAGLYPAMRAARIQPVQALQR
ncbi:putative ABC transport system permease protein [Actinoplanes tereljensis]|uniref:ABC transporter permease n=1 Tax=Paractinoplanes tereljensis TaxID=571912 RepID=A0A919NPH8_9ACTN|nr:ABC transporter permease [Actinoplanes tereljensis]GIF21686.1 ABC transporter permease [Actinoplanes tereljensis]